jgi:hypothetical protein
MICGDLPGGMDKLEDVRCVMDKKGFVIGIMVVMLLYSASAVASTGAPSAYNGADALQTVENIIYGPWGMLIGIVLFIAAIFSWLKFGAGTGVVVALFAVVIFLVPAIISGAQQFGATHAGYSQQTG